MNPFLSLNPKDLVSVLTALINTPSVSQEEDLLCRYLQEWIAVLRPESEIIRLSNTLIVKIGNHDTDPPVVFAGHLDTVPPAPSLAHGDALNNTALIKDGLMYGLGAADMKSGVAVMLALLADINISSTFIFYEAEEIADRYNGLRLLLEEQSDLLLGKWAILLEPTNGNLEMGCQGALTVEARTRGVRAHSARPWMGENAIHKAVKILDRAVNTSKSQVEVEINGLTYTSTLQITKLSGGIAGNVIPDDCRITINHRYSPEKSPEEALTYVRDEICEDADEVEVISNSSGAVPAFDHPLVSYAQAKGRSIVPKVAWTDVARFYSIGIPALNCGPGDPELCHRADEHIEIKKLEETYEFLSDFIKQTI